jgi:hypothetical protein
MNWEDGVPTSDYEQRERERAYKEEYNFERVMRETKEHHDMEIRHRDMANRDRDALDARIHERERSEREALNRYHAEEETRGLRRIERELMEVSRADRESDRRAYDTTDPGFAAHATRLLSDQRAHDTTDTRRVHDGGFPMRRVQNGGFPDDEAGREDPLSASLKAAELRRVQNGGFPTRRSQDSEAGRADPRSASLKAYEDRHFKQGLRGMGLERQKAAENKERNRLRVLGDSPAATGSNSTRRRTHGMSYD